MKKLLIVPMFCFIGMLHAADKIAVQVNLCCMQYALDEKNMPIYGKTLHQDVCFISIPYNYTLGDLKNRLDLLLNWKITPVIPIGNNRFSIISTELVVPTQDFLSESYL